MVIALGSDHLGMGLKNKIAELLNKLSIKYTDFGVNDESPVDYPDIGEKVSLAVSNGEFDRGILICGTGIGMSITANKVKNVYAAVCTDIYQVERSILSNNANVLCLGALVTGPSSALALVEKWVSLKFKESPSIVKINKILAIEERQFAKE
jgi:ribose 5-phosphate isomerase B